MSTSKSDRRFVLVAVADFTPASDFALGQAGRIASRIAGCGLHVIHVAEPGTSEARLAEIARELETHLGAMRAALGIGLANALVHVRSGDAAHQIAALAAECEADVIVVAPRHPRHIRDLFIGSLADQIMRIATCPVLVANPKHEKREVQDPVVEPPCKDCESVRALSANTQPRCARHAEHHLHSHRYTYRRELPFVQHDSAIFPTGVGTSSYHRV